MKPKSNIENDNHGGGVLIFWKLEIGTGTGKLDRGVGQREFRKGVDSWAAGVGSSQRANLMNRIRECYQL